ncbi:NHLM bacteriocin system ABC transporter ATP-binding protein [Streptomyces sp. Ag109_O5-1]|uniref:NHLP bacteriocin export ABC transporter permease/ATPase subunit n=1 Tax=Streptomyces sp. Ag109_O5-1 TaxID=1938851 RepID=UPI000F5099EA|nr:NHLP bacteriocin export ABC transporter permease/ATPase subunit [Streptomyces sp. Ag109_O5-1]RPE39106.1 NHLM bacteriocin system ABC transporter ATP-binding protein [Streptomyces sp. Ag109_O5-1]
MEELLRRTEWGTYLEVDRRGTRLEADGRPWLIASGIVEVFVVAEDGPGRWQFLGETAVGTVLLPPVPGTGRALLVRPADGTQVEIFRIDRPGMWGNDLDAGIARGLNLLLGFPERAVPPRRCTRLSPGHEVELASGEHGRPADLVWVTVTQGEVRVDSADGHRTVADGEFLALTGQDWLVAVSAARLTVRSTSRQVAEVGWASLCAVSTELVLRLDQIIEQRDRRSIQQLEASGRADQAAAGRAVRLLRTALRSNRSGVPAAPVPGSDATLGACRIVADELGIDLAMPTVTERDPRIGPIEQVAVAARLRSRVIGLTGAWWKTDVGPLVGHRADGHQPVALVFRFDAYYAHDPETGNRTRVSAGNQADYEPAGVMFYRPLPESAVSTWGLLRYGIRGSGRDIRRLLTSILVSVGLAALVPLSFGQVLGRFVLEANATAIVQVCIGLVVASLSSAVFGVLQNMALLRVEGRLESELQAAVWDRMLRLRATFFRGFSTGELAAAAIGVGKIRSSLADVSSPLLSSAAAVVVNLVALLIIAPPLCGVAALFLLVQGMFFLAVGSPQLRWQRRSIALGNELTDRVLHTLQGLGKLRVTNAVDRAFAQWATLFAQHKETQKRAGWYQNVLTVFNAVYLPFSSLVVYALVAAHGLGALSTADFLTFNTTLGAILNASSQLTNSILSVTSVVPIFDRLRPLLAEPLEVSSSSLAPPPLNGDIEVRNLTFGYGPDSPPVLSDLSFRIGAGQMAAIVGPSGCGKSTLLRLLLGFEQPSAGTILYDGQDLARLDQAAVRRQCGVVLQQARPFRGSILQAITGGQDYSIDEAWQAAELAGIADDIRAMPMTMHTLITDGSAFSGGQRQRLVIANALIRKPRILFFDEATSALDNATQRIVTKSTQRLNSTRIVIAHRLSTVMEADDVIVLANGRIVQQGPPAQLVADRSGLFYQLVQQQMPHSISQGLS